MQPTRSGSAGVPRGGPRLDYLFITFYFTPSIKNLATRRGSRSRAALDRSTAAPASVPHRAPHAPPRLRLPQRRRGGRGLHSLTRLARRADLLGVREEPLPRRRRLLPGAAFVFVFVFVVSLGTPGTLFDLRERLRGDERREKTRRERSLFAQKRRQLATLVAPRLSPRRAPREAVDPTRCLLYTSPSPRDLSTSRMPSSA